ncbi:MAG: NAD(P)/FAD-dependent oxidoreductase [Alphaproteobacteria bacterium]|nr:NAD(P)/FAD-dependent oxidoreductase [Alphaproteobacteria bacterium]
MADEVECVVVGAGVIGLAIARRLALAGIEVIVLEAADTIGSETSSRNSEVIHAGIYYPAGSLKARLCVSGRDALYRYAASRGVAHRRIGKLIVAVDEPECAALRALQRKGAANGVGDLALLDAADAGALEPAVRCLAALHSPSTGIIDSHALMLSFQGEAEERGAMIAFRSPLTGGRVLDAGFDLAVGGPAPLALRCRLLINAAGLAAQSVAASLGGMPATRIPRRHLSKGTYFIMRGRAPFRRLIYPIPEAAGLGIHLTLDLAGQARFGPDQQWVEAIDYTVDDSRAASFYEAIRRYYPDLADDSLQPGYVGVRPKVRAPGEPMADFVIDGPEAHGVPGLVNLFGIESPGLTASLAIADAVLARLRGGAVP